MTVFSLSTHAAPNLGSYWTGIGSVKPVPDSTSELFSCGTTPLIRQGVVGVIGPHAYPVSGTICPMNVAGTTWPVSGFTPRRPSAVVIGRYRTGGLPPQVGSNFSKEKIEDSPEGW